jgi:hypothetical protein
MDLSKLEAVATFCGKCSCGCPQLFFDPGAVAEQRIVLTDDFGNHVRMSVSQFRDLLDQAVGGRLQELLEDELVSAG